MDPGLVIVMVIVKMNVCLQIFFCELLFTMDWNIFIVLCISCFIYENRIDIWYDKQEDSISILRYVTDLQASDILLTQNGFSDI